MKTEIEKMYENVGIEKQASYYCSFDYGAACPYDNMTCPECPYYKEGDEPQYPDFSAEKQLWLIKRLSDIDEYVDIHYDRYKGLFEMQTGSGGLCVCNDFEDALASRVNLIWQDLTASL